MLERYILCFVPHLIHPGKSAAESACEISQDACRACITFHHRKKYRLIILHYLTNLQWFNEDRTRILNTYYIVASAPRETWEQRMRRWEKSVLCDGRTAIHVPSILDRKYTLIPLLLGSERRDFPLILGKILTIFLRVWAKLTPGFIRF